MTNAMKFADEQVGGRKHSQRLAWATPSLTTFGDVNKLTEGGSGLSGEGVGNCGSGMNQLDRRC